MGFLQNWGGVYSGADNFVHGDSVTFVTTPNLTTTSGNMIIMGLVLNTGDVISSIVDSKSNSWANDGPIHSDANNGNNAQSGIWSAKNITGGAGHNITVTLTATGYIAIAACEYGGMDTAAPFDKTAVADGTSTALNSGATLTTVQANEILIGMGSADLTTNSSYAAGASFTIRVAGAQGVSTLTGVFEERVVSATGTYSAPATHAAASVPWAMRIATYKSLVVSTLNQFIYRFRKNDGSEPAPPTGASWETFENGDVTLSRDQIFRLRQLIYASAGNPGSKEFQFEYREPNGKWKVIEPK